MQTYTKNELNGWRNNEEKGKGMKKELKCITYIYQLPTKNVTTNMY